MRFPRGLVIFALVFVIAMVGCNPRAQGGLSGSSLILLEEIYYYSLVANEYVVIHNQGEGSVDLSSWTLSDLEGTITFPPGTVADTNQRIIVTQNSSLYHRDTLGKADFQYGGGNAPAMIHSGGIFALSNLGDEVVLADSHGEIVDAFAYGSSTYAGKGWDGESATILGKGQVANRIKEKGFLIDTNKSSDWNALRSRVIGQSSFPLEVFEFDGVAQTILSPDFSSQALSSIVANASRSIYLNAYDISNVALWDMLASAIVRGVDVRILAEGEPVGGMEERELSFLMSLSELGAGVRLMLDNASLGVKARYRFDHAKYMVVDNETIVVGSENWASTGYPSACKAGNRGWGIALDSVQLSLYMATVFLEDWNPKRMDSVDIRGVGISTVQGGGDISSGFQPSFYLEPFYGHFSVIPVVGPDTTLEHDAILALIESAQTTLDLEQFYISRSWGAQSNMYLEAVVNAARRDVAVRVLLDSSWYNIEADDTTDNDDTVAYLNQIAQREGIPLSAKLANTTSHNLVKIHNKGLIVDGESVLISSINWNLNSVTANREVGLIVQNNDIASFFIDVFNFDWKDDIKPPFADAGDDLTVVEGREFYLSATSSRDDVGIESYRWDIDEDGEFELDGQVVSWQWSNPGKYRVMLRVEDAWGNAACDWLNVTVTRDESTPDVESSPLTWLIAPVAAAIIGCVILALTVRRRK